MTCKSCDSSKGDRRLYEWYELDRRYEVPRIAEGITTESKDKTVSEKQRQLAKLNLEGRKQVVKFIATHVALDLSSRTTSKARKILDDYQSRYPGA